LAAAAGVVAPDGMSRSIGAREVYFRKLAKSLKPGGMHVISAAVQAAGPADLAGGSVREPALVGSVLPRKSVGLAGLTAIMQHLEILRCCGNRSKP
jgi:hypothetical protein